jgi:3-phosphoshikimate 1-carboxyvinyltransferase
VAGALGCQARFTTRGRLSERPLAPYDRLLSEHGMRIERDGRELLGTGQLQSGVFRLPADISSQYFSGLLMALPLLPGDSLLQAERSPESPGYIRLTERVLSLAGVRITRESESVWRIPGSQHPQLPAEVRAEGDWSNAAFFLCLGALSETGVTVRGLDPESVQGDRAVLPLLRDFGASVTVSDDAVTVRRGRCLPLSFSAADIPDLVPVLAVLCCAADGPSRITDAARLRYKESDRLHAVSQLILSLGGIAEELPDGLVIHGRGALRGGTADAFNDHRIAMSAAVAASLAAEPVTLTGAECVRKSYPAFWEDFLSLSTEKEAAP